MAFTRFHDDPVRIMKSLEQSTFAGRYMLDTPGPGLNMPYMEDPQIRIHTWGANMWTNSTNLESELRGLGRPLTHNPKTYEDAKIHQGRPIAYPVSNIHVEDSRYSHPVCMYRDIEIPRWETPILDPQANLERPTNHNISTRILTKDHFVPKYPLR